MTERERRENDLALAPNEYAYIMDTTKGQVNTYVGPHKASLSQTDEPVVFNSHTKSFDRVTLEDAKQKIPTAPEGWYIVLKNPATDDINPHSGTVSNTPDLRIGNKVNIPGPVSFAPWPGQMVRVVKGHRLRQNQYLLTCVYNEESARRSAGDAIVAGTDGGEVAVDVSSLVTGLLDVIKGTDVSFYIPPTGIEVVRCGREYVRDAVTLERLEYCLLLDQSGGKRYVQGPSVVFPKPTENFVGTDSDTPHARRKFRAIELNQNSGLYIKVIAAYTDDDETEHKLGDELFVTGKEQAIYFPREEHAVIKYGEQEKHYGIAIPKGEARYVLNRLNGGIRLEKGPSVFLADPRLEVVVRRILDPRHCQLLYPGNSEALQYNLALKAQVEDQGDGGAATALGVSLSNTPIPGSSFARAASGTTTVATSAPVSYSGGRGFGMMGGGGLPGTYSEVITDSNSRSPESTTYSADSIDVKLESRRIGSSRSRSDDARSGDSIKRGTTFTPPRTVTLNTKFEGAVTINVYEGYAVMLTDKSGNRRVIHGPQTALLEYDESPHFLRLSTDKPKNTDTLKETVYLQVKNNYVTDIVAAETKDFCNVKVKMSYRVNFMDKANPEIWFSVENYVKLLCDHMRSMVRNFIKKQSVEEFYQNNTSMLRDLILGTSEDGKRPGRPFDENNMHIYDVEVLSVKMDDDIENMLIGEQRDVIQQTLSINKSRRDLAFTSENEGLRRQVEQERAKTSEQVELLARANVEARHATEMVRVSTIATIDETQKENEVNIQEFLDTVASSERTRRQSEAEVDISLKRQRVDLDIKHMTAEADQTRRKAEAITPDLIAALQGISDTDTIEKVAQAIGPLQMLKVLNGAGISEIIGGIFKGSPLGDRLSRFNGNGKRPVAKQFSE